MISLLKHEPRPKDIDEEASNNLENNPKHFFVHWKALLGMLLRTVPYLDVHKAGMPPVDSTSRKSSASEFYNEVMPQWLESLSSIDLCPDFDFLWLVMFCFVCLGKLHK